MKQNSKLRQNEEQETTQQQHSQQKAEAKEFSTVDELLRYDAAQNPVPPNVADKLSRSAEAQASPPSWWKRLVTNFRAK